MARNLRIMTWNTNGIVQHTENLIVTLVDQKIDLCLISETHFTTESYNKLQGFDAYHTMQPNNCVRGGSAVVIKNKSHITKTSRLRKNNSKLHQSKSRQPLV